jgi:hypothetical protein
MMDDEIGFLDLCYVFTLINSALFSCSATNVSDGNCQGALVDESGMIRNHMGKPNKSDKVAVQGSPCASTPQG